MKRAGIVTIMGDVNYGNRLQNYAVEQVLNHVGVDAVTIQNIAKSRPAEGIASRIFKKRLPRLVHLMFKVARKKLESILYAGLMKERVKKFREFSDKFLHLSDFCISETNIDEHKDKLAGFDFFVVGSDQVWNPHYRFNSPIDFLTFAHARQRIAFSASIGVDNLPPDSSTLYAQWLKQFNAISVREKSGAKIVKGISGIDAEVLVDPTMVLDAASWDAIMKEPATIPGKPYILAYFISGELNEKKAYLKALRKHTNWDVVRLWDIKDKAAYATGPSEFIYYVKNASFVITDSFHGAVFSIIYQKPFVVFGRGGHTVDIGSRIETLLTSMSLMDRKVGGKGFDPGILTVDFRPSELALRREREKAMSFMRQAIAKTDIASGFDE